MKKTRHDRNESPHTIKISDGLYLEVSPEPVSGINHGYYSRVMDKESVTIGDRLRAEMLSHPSVDAVVNGPFPLTTTTIIGKDELPWKLVDKANGDILQVRADNIRGHNFAALIPNIAVQNRKSGIDHLLDILEKAYELQKREASEENIAAYNKVINDGTTALRKWPVSERAVIRTPGEYKQKIGLNERQIKYAVETGVLENYIQVELRGRRQRIFVDTETFEAFKRWAKEYSKKFKMYHKDALDEIIEACKKTGISPEDYVKSRIEKVNANNDEFERLVHAGFSEARISELLNIGIDEIRRKKATYRKALQRQREKLDEESKNIKNNNDAAEQLAFGDIDEPKKEAGEEKTNLIQKIAEQKTENDTENKWLERVHIKVCPYCYPIIEKVCQSNRHLKCPKCKADMVRKQT